MKNKNTNEVECKICKSKSIYLFSGKILNKYPIDYFQCTICKFIQTEEPFWLDEAYSSAIGILDIGLLYRNNIYSNSVPQILDRFSTMEDSYLDYGGGYGVFVRMMRDKGYDFYLYDKYCENLYAKYFELNDYKGDKFKALTAFEVFEHLVDPIKEINSMLKHSDVLIFSTELQPDKAFTSVDDWWYFVPFGGQHIALYHLFTLQKISEIFNCTLYSNGTDLHILTKLNIGNPFITQDSKAKFKIFLQKLKRKKNNKIAPKRKSLLMKDFEYYKKKLEIK